MNLNFTHESRDTLKSFSLFLAVQTTSELNMEHSVSLEIEIWKISRRRSRSPDNAKFGHFPLLFCKGHKEIYKARAQLLFCSWNLLFSDVPVPVAVVVSLSSLIITMAIHLLPMNDVFTTSRSTWTGMTSLALGFTFSLHPSVVLTPPPLDPITNSPWRLP